MIKLVKHILIITFVCTGFSAFSQYKNSFRDRKGDNGHHQSQKLEAVREGYVDKKLDLTADEASRFWPVYRQYHAEISEVRRLKRLNNSNAQANGNDQVKKEIQYEERLVDIRKHYNELFLKILPPQKVSMIYKSEREFTDELIKQLGERRTPDDEN